MFKNIKNKTGIFAVIGLVFIIGFSALISNLTAPEEAKPIEFEKVSYAEYEELFDEKNEGVSFVYVGRPGCSFCVKIQPLLKTIEEEEKIIFNYLNTDTMTEDNFNSISSTSEAFQKEWGTPTLIAIVDGKAFSYLDGYREIEDIRKFVNSAKSELKDE